ncbi:hypothetical protein BDB00DRAFT_828653 [Zychaea mexicana]|uniref:uncharacterized protein n=1 Tax=Zychaea mexicana TaxID=64656 RepID=UPI0022FEBDCE|nr:uncharacterized protein BDB00DRAFT_828653 [Zychaea mexicana]KAI9492351.1 hypothetical protein BDB00DRAFT_828653 [Zychaea mexicana]
MTLRILRQQRQHNKLAQLKWFKTPAHCHYRYLSSSTTTKLSMAAAPPPTTTTEQIPPAAFTPLQKLAPTFYARGNDITPLYEPHAFYTELKTRILNAKERVFIAALYIGHAEQELVETLREALRRSDRLQVYILIDCLRGTRVSKGKSSATLLLSLIKEFPSQVQVSLYHTPDLTGMLKKTLPQRFNEGIGLMHLKIYGFDDSVMLSGANLSQDYFTDRQDRYMVFDNNRKLSSYYHDLLNTVRSFSYQLEPGMNEMVPYRLVMEHGTMDPVFESRRFKKQVHGRLVRFIQKYKQQAPSQIEGGLYDTAVLPVIQMGPFGIRQDEKTTLRLLEIAHENGDWTIDLTSGYFNFTDRYKAFILRTQARFRFLTASPEANGFFNSKGVSRYLPPAYTWIEKQFFNSVQRSGRENDITIEEYKRPGWTYHAKGLWAYLGAQTRPVLTMIGSPNFGHRSSERDLEAQAIVITQNKRLQEALHKEVKRLHDYSELVTRDTFTKQDRLVPYGVRAATAMIKTML